jgi:multidrug efflux system membrane fusion protein
MKPSLVLIPIALAAASCSRTSAASRAGGPPAVPVTVAEARVANVPDRLDAVASVEAYETVSVKAQAAGQITAVRFAEGRDVRAGDLLFQIDPRPYQAALAQAEAALARDQAQSTNAAADARRAELLFGQGVLSKEQHDQILATAQSQQATVAADRAAVDNARLNLAYSQVRSPISGRTGSVLVHEGNVVKAVDGNPLVVINRIDPIYVSFSIPEKRLGAIRAAQSREALVVEAVAAGDAGPPPTGRVTFIDNQVDPTSGTIRLKATFPNPTGRLWPGQFVTARMTLGQRAGVVVVPAAAVQAGQQGSFAFVVKPDHTVEQRTVTVQPAGDEAIVDSGITAGETVVVDGQMGLVSGTRVQAKAAQAPALASAAVPLAVPASVPGAAGGRP